MNSDLNDIIGQIDIIDDKIEELESNKFASVSSEEDNEEITKDKLTFKTNQEISELNKKKDDLIKNKKTLESSIEISLLEYESKLSERLDIEETKLETYQDKIESLNLELDNLEEDDEDSDEYINSKKILKTNNDEARKIRDKILRLKTIYDDLYTRNIFDNYTSKKERFSEILVSNLDLMRFVPRMILWENDDKYILPNSIAIKDILKIRSEKSISRPLINIFRIGMGVTNLEDFKSVLTNLSENGSKRSSANSKINSKINQHIHDVWQEYDQDLQISIEQDQIRIEVFDPQRNDDAEYFELKERSQGCKAFLSFILTIGAESKTNLINNNLLILDEPESHLHPSGQRFMLKELKNIAKSNQVVYATHSNHMIIKDNYDQHFIVVKKEDKTTVFQSQKKRIGFFMQEEVLYDAMGVDLSSDLSSIEDYNFVFEGLGDVLLFNYFYEKILKADNRPFKIKDTKFYQGGKCSDIKRAFQSRPIQLGTKWVFIIDSDKPANELNKFISGKYKNYVTV